MSPDKNGIAAFSHLKQVESSTGIVPKELEEYYSLSIPLDFVHYYEDFLELSRRRTKNESGYNAISFPEIYAWSEVNKISTSHFQVEVIGMLDSIWLKVASEKE